MATMFSFRTLFGNKLFRTDFAVCRHLRGKPPSEAKNLEQRIAESLNRQDAEIVSLVDIGFPRRPELSRVERKARDETRKEIRKDVKLFQAAKHGQLKIDFDELKSDWKNSEERNDVRRAGEHYHVFKDTFQHGIFTPVVSLNIQYPFDDETNSVVHRGNIILPKEASTKPSVNFQSEDNDLWSLLLTNPDGNLINNEQECLHWFVGNICGNDLKSGEELFPYLQPFPVRGGGYQRMIFVLYKQTGRIDYSQLQKPTHEFNLECRSFRSFDFYKRHQSVLTPAGLAFFQTVWDETMTNFFHQHLEMKEPVFEYCKSEIFVQKQKKYPIDKSFNRYLDTYRDGKEIKKEILLKRLKSLTPFKEESPMPKYPNIFRAPPGTASWQKADLWKERNRIGKFEDLRPWTAYPQPEFDFMKMYWKTIDTELLKKKK